MSAATGRPQASSHRSPQGEGTPVSEPLIRLRGITKVYGQGATALQALKGVNLDIEAGDFVAIMGPSGSGKSTAMNTLGGLDTPTSGEYLFQGMHVETLTRDQRARLRRRFLGFVFQGFNLLSRTSALENVELPMLYLGVKTSERLSRAREALELVGLGDRIHSMPNQLSGGQQQRVAIARALVNRPTIILADEPTGNLDSRTSVEVMGVFQYLNEEHGITIALVTHEHDIAHYTRRVVVFKDGRIKRDEPVENRRSAREELERMPAVIADEDEEDDE